MDDYLSDNLAELLAVRPGQTATELANALSEQLAPMTRTEVNRALYGAPSRFHRTAEPTPIWTLGTSEAEASRVSTERPDFVLRGIAVASWKAFGALEEVPLAPLTLLVGQNSAGKSSLIQALLSLKQSVQGSAGAVPRLILNGPLAELGSFSNVAYSHDLGAAVRIGISFVGPDVATAVRAPLPEAAVRQLSFSWEWDESSASSQLRGCTLKFGDLDSVRFERLHRHGEDWAPNGGDERPSRYEVHEHDVERLTNLVSAVYGLAEVARDDGADSRSLTQHLRDGLRPSFDDSQFVPGAIQTFSTAAQVSSPLPPRVTGWNNWSSSLRRELAAVLERIVYLGPLRQPLERVSTLRGLASEQVGQAGEHTAELLSKDPALASEVSDWFARLGIPYRITVAGFGDGGIRDAVGDVAAVLLEDSGSGGGTNSAGPVLVHPAAVGFGIGQVMPIVVQALVSTNKIICIEQPEVHLHPRLQSTLADLIVHSMNTRRNQFLIETHSEHLLLRLQRRIREGVVDPKSVKIVYLDSAPGGAAVAEFSPDDGGDLPPEWPRGFFADRLSEMLP